MVSQGGWGFHKTENSLIFDVHIQTFMKTPKELARVVIFALRTVFIEKFPIGYSAQPASGGRFTRETDKVQLFEMVVG